MASLVTPAVVEALSPLLKFIYAGEGGYDSYNRGVAGDSPGAYPGGGFSRRSIAQIMDLQANEKVFAVGAPQFIPSTLAEVVKTSGIDITEKFTPEVQDCLAVWLLIGTKRPALAAYLLGKSDDLDKAHTALAMEWASIPLPSGFGYYDGDKGGNKATQKVSAVRAALKAGRAAIAEGGKKATGVAEKNTKVKAAVLFKITATQATFLKKSTEPAAELPDNQKVAVVLGKSYEVVEVKDEIPRDAHQEVVLGGGAGTWVIFAPHWQRTFMQAAAPVSDKEINWKNFEDKVSAHLTVGEVLQWDPRRAPVPGSTEEARILKTAEQYELMRKEWGHPIGVSSFFRPEPINREVGGVRGSHHVSGFAMDLYPVGGGGLEEFYTWSRPRWTGGLGDGRWRGFLHFDLNGGPGHFVPGAGRLPAREWKY